MNNAWIEVAPTALRGNIAALRRTVPARVSVIFVVKANAYGHGLYQTVRLAAESGIRWFGVAHPQEAGLVRTAVPDAHILVMGAIPPSEASVLAGQRITTIVVDVEHGRGLAAVASAAGLTLEAHLKIDTGMGRLGCPWEDAVETYRSLCRLPGLRITGLCSHFATVEAQQPDLAKDQARRFKQVTGAIERLHGEPLFKHLSSSRALLCQPEWDFDAVRPGICLYGYGANDPALRFETRPVLQWKCRVMQVKRVAAGQAIGYYGTYVVPLDTRIAVLSAGYADGYHRALSNRGHVLIRGRRCPVIGRVSMNWITVDTGPDSTVQAGDEAVLIGEQKGVSVWAGELARICRTIPYEILTGIHPESERRYEINGASTNPPTCK